MRLPYAPSEPINPSDTDIYSRIAARRAPRPLTSLDLTLLHSPPVADGWNTFLGAIRTRTSLPSAILELAICRVAALNGAVYEWTHHAPLASKAGLSVEALATLLTAPESQVGEEEARDGADGDKESRGGLGAKEWAVLAYTDQMTRSVAVGEEAFDRLRKFFTEKEIVEITATVAAYNCVSRFLVALDVGEMNGERMKSAEELIGEGH